MALTDGIGLDPTTDTLANFRVLFYAGKNLIPAVYCSDFYKDEIDSNADDGFWKNNIVPNVTICPDTSNITDGNEYEAFAIAVMSCETAKAIEVEKGIPTYSNITCNDPDLSLTREFFIENKFVVANFNADRYYQNQTVQ